MVLPEAKPTARHAEPVEQGKGRWLRPDRCSHNKNIFTCQFGLTFVYVSKRDVSFGKTNKLWLYQNITYALKQTPNSCTK